jgi:hypothetical protein
MSSYQWILELILIGLLGATLFYAMRLERTISVLRKDRVALGEVLSSIKNALDDAERGVDSLRHMADGTGRALTSEIEAALQAQADLRFLLDRLDSVAVKVESTIRAGRAAAPSIDEAKLNAPTPVHSKAERDLLRVLRQAK